ncbi:homeobox protein HMX1 isoform X2 [Rhinoraja longicauda]
MPDKVTEGQSTPPAKVSSFFIENLLRSNGKGKQTGGREENAGDVGPGQNCFHYGKPLHDNHCNQGCCQISAQDLCAHSYPLRGSTLQWYAQARPACPSPHSPKQSCPSSEEEHCFSRTPSDRDSPSVLDKGKGHKEICRQEGGDLREEKRSEAESNEAAKSQADADQKSSRKKKTRTVFSRSQ